MANNKILMLLVMYIHHLCFRTDLVFFSATEKGGTEDSLMRDTFQFEVLQTQHEEIKQKVSDSFPSPLNTNFFDRAN